MRGLTYTLFHVWCVATAISDHENQIDSSMGSIDLSIDNIHSSIDSSIANIGSPVDNVNPLIDDVDSSDDHPPFNIADYSDLRLHGHSYQLLNPKTDYLGCDELISFSQSLSQLSSGWTKAVYIADSANLDLNAVIKYPNLEGRTFTSCVETQELDSGRDAAAACYGDVKRRIVKEIILLDLFRSKHVVEMLGYCIPEGVHESNVSVAVLLQRGKALDLITFYQLPWELRLRALSDTIDLVQDLSRIQSCLLNDVKVDQFVHINGSLILIDLDDVTVCGDTHCAEQSEIDNRRKIYDVFGQSIRDSPAALNQLVKGLLAAIPDTTVPLNVVKRMIEDVKTTYRNFRTPGTSTLGFSEIKDLSVQSEMQCSGSYILQSCVLSAADLHDAQALCASLEFCNAFTWMDKRTWTGRWLIHVSDNTDTTSTPGKTTYFKPR